MITIIAAMDKNRAIGKDGDLLTYLPGDLPRFKKLTTGHRIIMGRKTFDSLRNGPLKDRTNMVITRNRELKIDGAEIYYSLEAAIDACSENEEVFIIGGGEIYNASIDFADKLYLTEIDNEFEADTFFPPLSDKWTLSESIENSKDPELKFSYNTYIKS